MSSTRTGSFPIGFRTPFGKWVPSPVELAKWAADNDFSAIDLNKTTAETVAAVRATGITIGSVDLSNFGTYITADADERAALAADVADYVRATAADGPLNFFCVLRPADPNASRADNFGYLIEGLKPIVAALEETGSKLAIEGWPGPGCLCCTPEGYRALFAQLPSDALAINYDPSHLIRMGIDPLRFLREFIDRVVHVHAKDTRIDTDGVYEFGTEQPPTFAQGPGFGTPVWRYTIPGHGEMDWVTAFRILADAGYTGAVCIELEDGNFNGEEPSEKAGLNYGRAFLEGC